jgi:hypothetical protein
MSWLAILPPLPFFFIFQIGKKLKAYLDGVPFLVTDEAHYLIIFFLMFLVVLSLKTQHTLEHFGE